MRNMKRIIFAVSALLIVFVTVVFMLENKQAVSLVFFGWALPELPVAASLIMALLVGMMIGPFLAFIFVRKKKNPSRIS
ncbi:hypothetical protein BK667_17855 [Pseudomonas frederiksbergensis]|nr:lipopolysaccharide assembly protein LapA domain-containing protein [Pseudomonas frederiksbergensis]RON50701.1 hypothetical protein BK667_17855 [Pseudomonas frederiksbergensis]